MSWDDLMPLLDYIYLFDKETIGNYFGMDPELTRRMHRLYRPGLSLEETVCLLHSRNRTDSALRRALLHCLLRIREYDFLAGSNSLIFPYIRVLGFRRTAAPLLRRIREASSAAVIQKPAAGRALFAGNSRERDLFETDLRCSQLYEQIAAKRAGGSRSVSLAGNRSYRMTPVTAGTGIITDKKTDTGNTRDYYKESRCNYDISGRTDPGRRRNARCIYGRRTGCISGS